MVQYPHAGAVERCLLYPCPEDWDPEKIIHPMREWGIWFALSKYLAETLANPKNLSTKHPSSYFSLFIQYISRSSIHQRKEDQLPSPSLRNIL